MSTWVKICGITNKEDALHAVESGADLIGFIFWNKSKRYVPEGEVKSIVDSLGGTVKTVGVFVDEDLEELNKLVIGTGIDYVQLHGSESIEYVRGVEAEVIKAVRVKGKSDIEKALEFKDVADYILLDTFVEGEQGGTGKTFDWSLVSRLSDEVPVILSGGLNVDNIRDAIEVVKPFGVDVSSGVEKTPGVKDSEKVTNFIHAVRSK